MKIGIAYDLRGDYPAAEGDPPDSHLEFSTVGEIDGIVEGLERLGHDVRHIGNITHMARFLAEGGTVDLVFNHAAGVWGRAREAQVPSLLEAFRVPYTGSDSLTLSLCLDKGLTKLIWQTYGLATAPFGVVENLDDVDSKTSALLFPLFTKPLREGASKGITADARVHNLAQLREQVRTLIELYRQPVLVESFLPGREFTVGVLGGGTQARVLGLLEVYSSSPGGINTSADKEEWEQHLPNHFGPVADAAIVGPVADLALAAYQAMQCQGVGRVDVRCDQDGHPFLLEINPLPTLHPTHSALPLIARQARLSYEALLDEILDNARQRWGL